MIKSIIVLLDTEFKTSTNNVDIAKGKYKLPENIKELSKAIKTIKSKWKNTL